MVGNVVTLDGEIPSLSHKRLAGVLAWWVPGSRDVVNGLGVEPPEEDNDDEVSDAVRLVPAVGEREMAKFDAWYVFGVDKIVNRIDVRP